MSTHVWRAASVLGIVLLSFLGSAPVLADDNETEFTGTVQTMPASGSTGDWMIAGRTVHADESTEIDQEKGTIGVGAVVEVKGMSLMDGSVQPPKSRWRWA
jgi:hypothetical protein